MAGKSLNRVELIGNLTRDPELRYTPQGTAVCSFGLATNRSWTTDTGEKKEDTEFHRIVAWNKLAELCSQFLTKGRKVYLDGRLATRSWTGQDGQQRQTTEIVINDMILLDSKMMGERSEAPAAPAPIQSGSTEQPKPAAAQARKAAGKKAETAQSDDELTLNTLEDPEENVNPDDIPF